MWLMVPWDFGLADEDRERLAADADGACPAAADAEIAALMAAEAGRGDFFVPGGLSRPGGRAGGGFAAGGVADAMTPGAALAGLTATAWGQRAQFSDDELVGVMRAWRRLAAWAQAGELAAVAELAARRDAQVAAGADPHLAGHFGDELAAALVLTGRAAGQLADFAAGLAGRPATAAALGRGEIDRAKAWIIYEATIGLEPGHAAAVEAAVLASAPRQTTGQLRRAARRAVLAAGPAAASRRQQEAAREARVEVWHEPAGTAALAGRDLPAAEVLAADRHISALARQLKDAGATGGMDALRARVYTALLLGIPVTALLAQTAAEATGQPGPGPGPDGTSQPAKPDPAHSSQAAPGSQLAPGKPDPAHSSQAAPGSQPAPGKPDPAPGSQAAPASQAALSRTQPAGGPGQPAQPGGPGQPAGLGAAGVPDLHLTGTINLTMPLATLFGDEAPGEAAGFGPLPATATRDLAHLLAAQPATRWCLTLTSPDGMPLGHACARHSARAPELVFTIKPLATGNCDHQRQSRGYQPSDLLRHLIAVRQPHCTYPGCSRPAHSCDLDHTTPYHHGGRTCECNLAPLCRRHHQAKQTQGWHLEQPQPGSMSWTLPHGRSYRTGPSPYPPGGP